MDLRNELRRSAAGKAELLARLAGSSTRDLIAHAQARDELEAAEGAAVVGAPSGRSSLARYPSNTLPAVILQQLQLPPDLIQEVPITPLPPSGTNTDRRASLPREHVDALDELAALRTKRDSAVKRGSMEAPSGAPAPPSLLDAVRDRLVATAAPAHDIEVSHVPSVRVSALFVSQPGSVPGSQPSSQPSPRAPSQLSSRPSSVRRSAAASASANGKPKAAPQTRVHSPVGKPRVTGKRPTK